MADGANRETHDKAMKETFLSKYIKKRKTKSTQAAIDRQKQIDKKDK